MQALVEKGNGRIIIETDSSNAANILNGFVEDEHPRSACILRCKDMLANIPFSLVTYVPRCSNSCADFVAKLGYQSTSYDVIWLDVTPPGVTEVLLNDIYICS